jgi:hypothetical protein
VTAVHLVACYSTAQMALSARAETAAGVDEVIAAVVEAVVVEPVVFTAARPDARPDTRSPGEVGAYLVGAVDAAAGVGALRYTTPVTTPDGEGSSSWHTVAGSGQPPPAAVEARLMGFPVSAAVPLERWRHAVTGFALGSGARPSGVAWRPVSPAAGGPAAGVPGPVDLGSVGFGSVGPDVLDVFAEAVMAAAGEVEARSRPAGVPWLGEDLAGPDLRSAPVDAAVAAGHLRAAGEVLAVARHRLRPVAGQQAGELPWADPAARVGYAAEQLAGLVPVPAGPPPRLPVESVAAAPNMDAVHRQFALAAGEVAEAIRRLRAALSGPVPAREIVSSVLGVVSGAVDPLRELARPRDG